MPPEGSEPRPRNQDVRLFLEMAIAAVCHRKDSEASGCSWDHHDPAWLSFRGDLGTRDLIELRLRNQMVPRPWMFDPSRLIPGASLTALRTVTDERLAMWLRSATAHAEEQPEQFLVWAAERLLPPGPRWRPSLPPLASNQMALELPGTGGLLAYRVISKNAGLYLQENFLIAGADWREALYAGLVAIELGVPSGVDLPFTLDEHLKSPALLNRRYDLILGSQERHANMQEKLSAMLSPGGQVVLL